MKDRVAGLLSQLPERNLEAMLISAPENRRYLSGFSGSAGYLLISKEQPILVTDSRYTEQAANQAKEYRVVQSRGGWDWLVDWLKETGVKRLGFESQNMTVATYDALIDVLKKDESLTAIATKSHRRLRCGHGGGLP